MLQPALTEPPYRVGFIVGSLSSDSMNRKLANALVRLAPEGMEFTEISIADLPLYNRDIDDNFPASATAFKEAISQQQALLFVTPEYNRSIPGALKNALDWASRPKGENVIAGKPTAVVGTSPGPIGTAVAQQQLRSVLSFLQAPQLNSPEVYLQSTPGLITDDGEVTNSGTEQFLSNYMDTFFEFIEHTLVTVPRAR